MNYTEMTVKQLKDVAKELNISGRHTMRREELLAAIESFKVEEVQTEVIETVTVQDQPQVIENKQPVRGGRIKVIEVWKDGKLVATVDGLIETLKWAVENGVCNQGWVKHSLKTGKETIGGRKFKEGGYLFRYGNKMV